MEAISNKYASVARNNRQAVCTKESIITIMVNKSPPPSDAGSVVSGGRGTSRVRVGKVVKVIEPLTLSQMLRAVIRLRTMTWRSREPAV
jgi:hypothetical protein